MGQLVAFGGSPVLNRAVVSEGSLYGSPVHWPQPINSKSLHRSTGAGKGAVTCPRPSYYFNTLCLPLRSFYLSDFSRTHHLGPSRGQTGAPRQKARGGVKWFIGNVCCWVLRKGSARMDSEQKCGGKQLVMNLTESCLWRVEAELTPEQLLGGFSSSHWWAFAALWWPHGPDSEERKGVHSRGGPGSGEWFILPPCHSLWATPLEMASNVTVLRRKISTLCLSVTAAQTDLLTSYVLLLALCVCISQSSTFQGSRHNVTPGGSQRLNYSIAFKSFSILSLPL